jgi:hypothetical protein
MQQERLIRQQLNLLARLGLFVASLALATAVSASDTRSWSEGNDYVRLDAASASNQHPVRLSAEQLTLLLGQFYKRVPSKEPVRYFSQDEISRLSTQLVPVFAKAKSGDDIEFGTSFRPGGFIFAPRELNAGRLFIENGQLNLLIGMCAAAQDIAFQQALSDHRELDHGSRSKPAEKVGCELLGENNAEQVNHRTDWLKLDINAALTRKEVPLPLSSSKSLTFGGASSPDRPAATPAQLPTAAAKSAEPAPLAMPSPPPNEVEGRLILLKQLHDKGLITDVEYDQKRAALLKQL